MRVCEENLCFPAKVTMEVLLSCSPAYDQSFVSCGTRVNHDSAHSPDVAIVAVDVLAVAVIVVAIAAGVVIAAGGCIASSVVVAIDIADVVAVLIVADVVAIAGVVIAVVTGVAIAFDVAVADVCCSRCSHCFRC